MIDVLINNTSLIELGVIPAHIEIGNAEPRLKYIEIAGRNGKLDVTDFLGVKYNNRIITIDCKVIADNSTSIRTTLETSFNGQLCHIIIADNPDKYWEGRVKIGTFVKDKSIYTFRITADVHPIAKDVDD